MKTIFITGASTGLGKATAKLFASKGWKVIATMRRPENEKDVAGEDAKALYAQRLQVGDEAFRKQMEETFLAN
jgi:NAD(P)-dependent dehydrogenase (short-subunit alcohol dehydrogenase family)